MNKKLSILSRFSLPHAPQIVGVAILYYFVPMAALDLVRVVRGRAGLLEQLPWMVYVYLAAHGLIFKRKWGCLLSLPLWGFLTLAAAVDFREMFEAGGAGSQRSIPVMLKDSGLWLWPVSVVLIIYSFKKHWPAYPWRYAGRAKVDKTAE